MSTNCKQGELARIVRSQAGNRDKIVQCVRAIGPKRVLHADDTFTVEFLWEIDRDLPNIAGQMQRVMADSDLRPIKDQPGDDETFTIAGRPHDIVVPNGVEALT